jgi:hypothetical protein
MKSLSIADLNFFELEFLYATKVKGGIQRQPLDLIEDSPFLFDRSLGFSRSSGTFSSGNGDSSISNSSTANAVAYAPEGKATTFTSTS